MAGEKGKAKKRKRPIKPDNPAQSARFIESAKKLGLGGSDTDFERAMNRLAPKKGKGSGS